MKFLVAPVVLGLLALVSTSHTSDPSDAADAPPEIEGPADFAILDFLGPDEAGAESEIPTSEVGGNIEIIDRKGVLIGGGGVQIGGKKSDNSLFHGVITSPQNCGQVFMPGRVVVQICGCDDYLCPPCRCQAT